jgi:hypothetical protein
MKSGWKYALGVLLAGVFWLPLRVEPRGSFETKISNDDWIGKPESFKNYSLGSQRSDRGDGKNVTDQILESSSPVQTVQSDRKILEDIKRIEYDEIKYGKESSEYYGFIRGKIPILISAPHGAPHFRRKLHRWVGEDEYTSSLAIVLGQLTGAYVIYVKNKTREDPNNDPQSKYKMAVARAVKDYHIQFLLDLHGSDEGRPYKIDVGIINDETPRSSCPTFMETIQEAFSDFQPEVFNKRFCAKDSCTLTSFAKNELGIEAAQIEINAKYRIVERKPDSSKAKKGIAACFKADPKDVLDLVARLERMIEGISQRIGNGTLADCDNP